MAIFNSYVKLPEGKPNAFKPTSTTGNGDVASDGSGMVLPTIQVVAQAEVRWLMCIIYYYYIRYFYLS